MAEQWLIDGYNLLRAPQPRNAQKRSLSREDLLQLVAGFASFKKLDTLLVLDGQGDPASLEAYRTDHFEAVFSQKVSADAYIEKLLYEHRDRRLVVVTNDRAVANIGRGSGASVLSTAQFYELMNECGKEASEFLQKERSRGHGFHRPFEDKLKDL